MPEVFAVVFSAVLYGVLSYFFGYFMAKLCVLEAKALKFSPGALLASLAFGYFPVTYTRNHPFDWMYGVLVAGCVLGALVGYRRTMKNYWLERAIIIDPSK